MQEHINQFLGEFLKLYNHKDLSRSPLMANEAIGWLKCYKMLNPIYTLECDMMISYIARMYGTIINDDNEWTRCCVYDNDNIVFLDALSKQEQSKYIDDAEPYGFEFKWENGHLYYRVRPNLI